MDHGWRWSVGSALVGAGLLLAGAGGGAVAPRYSDGPPPAHTGGFGEPTCYACHWDGELNADGGSVELVDLPERFVPGERYELGLRLAHPELGVAGFELAARFVDGPAEGLDAGVLHAGPGQGLVTAGTPAITYLRQEEEGGAVSRGEAVEWRFRWVAPEEDERSVVFHVSANAANGDVSEFGDHIYTLERVVSSASDLP